MSAQAPRLSPTGALIGLAAAALLLLLGHAILSSNTARISPVEPVALVAPPPAVPSPEEKKPEEEQPQPLEAVAANDYTPAEDSTSAPGPILRDTALGLAEEGGSGSDAFGLAGKPHGRELLLTAGGGGNPVARYVQFSGQLAAHVRAQLNQIDSLRDSCYTASVDVRVGSSGLIEGVQLRSSSGRPALDEKIRSALEAIAPLDVPPPQDMPWPVRLRLISHTRCAGETAGEGSARN